MGCSGRIFCPLASCFLLEMLLVLLLFIHLLYIFIVNSCDNNWELRSIAQIVVTFYTNLGLIFGSQLIEVSGSVVKAHCFMEIGIKTLSDLRNLEAFL